MATRRDDRRQETLRIHIAQEWTANDFAQLLTEFEVINEMAQFGEAVETRGGDVVWHRSFSPRYLQYSGADSYLELEAKEELEEISLRHFVREVAGKPVPLQITQLQYASPGFTDLTGVGRVMKEVREFVLGIVDRYIAKPDRDLAREERRQKILALKIANAEKIIKLANYPHANPRTRNALVKRLLISDEVIEAHLLEGKITSFADPKS